VGDHSDVSIWPDDDYAVVTSAVLFAELARCVHDGPWGGAGTSRDDRGHRAQVTEAPAEIVRGRTVLTAEQNDVPWLLEQVAQKGGGAVGMREPGCLWQVVARVNGG
jgi:hypothetical protein